MYEILKEEAGKFVCTSGWSFGSREQAQEFCDLWNGYFAALARLDGMPQTLSRGAYETAAQRLGVKALADSECDSYGVQYGEFGPYINGYKMEKYTPQYCLEMALAKRRLWGIEAERKAQPKAARQPDYPDGRELDCGCIVYYNNEVMSASQGSSCVYCYDRMSN